MIRGVDPGRVEAEFAGSGYGDFKRAVADRSSSTWPRSASATQALRADEAALEAALEAGAEKARAIASATLAEVREAMGIGSRGAPGPRSR